MTSPVETLSAPFESAAPHDPLADLIQPLTEKFDRLLRKQLLFHGAFTVLIGAEIALFFAFITQLLEASLLSFTLAFFFFTLFAYFVIRFYLRAKKGGEWMEMRDAFLATCRRWLRDEGEATEVAQLCEKASNHLYGREYRYLHPPRWLSTFQSSLERLSSWLFGSDVLQFREVLLETAIAFHVTSVKQQPTSLETHANLANAYVLLSTLYVLPTEEEDDLLSWWQTERVRKMYAEKFRGTAEKAIEELKILSDYAPNDPWIHLQLAYSYHDLQMPLDEIREYETIYRLRPDDKESLFRLGNLYFQQGFNAKGLRVYEELRRTHPHKAEQLISHYGAYTSRG